MSFLAQSHLQIFLYPVNMEDEDIVFFLQWLDLWSEGRGRKCPKLEIKRNWFKKGVNEHQLVAAFIHIMKCFPEC